MISGKDKISDFPKQFNMLEEEVKILSKNTRGIKIATWVGAVATSMLAFTALFPILKDWLF